MIVKGNTIILKLDGVAVAVATNANIELTQEIVECTPMPGSDDDDGWRHYVPGGHAWSVSYDALYTEDSSAIISDSTEETEYEADFSISDDEDEAMILSGDVQLSEVSVQATVHQLAKLSAKFICDNFPTITT